MKVCNIERLPNGLEILHYPREEEFLVRQIGTNENGCKSFLVKSPCKKLYEFRMTNMIPEELITLIEKGGAEGEKYESDYESIYDEYPKKL